MSNPKDVALDIVGHDKTREAITSASRNLDRLAAKTEETNKATGRLGKVASGGLDKLKFAAKAAAAGGVALVGAAMVVGIKAAADYQKIQAQTAAVLKSTKGAAGENAKGVQELAEKISGYSGMTDEAIQSGENLLLTFTNIQNKAGKGNKIFDRATATLADMSTALGEPPKTAAIQLGKALNDPIKGVSALQRVGVSFTAKQKAQITTLVKSGKTMQAQKVILGELNKEFGGSAKAAGDTFSGSMSKIKNSLMDALRDGLAPLLPYLQMAATWLAAKLPGAIAATTAWVDRLKAKFTSTGGAAGKITTAIRQVWTWLAQNLVPALQHAGQEVLPALGSALSGLGQGLAKLGPTFKVLATIITALVLPVIAKLITIQLKVLGPALKIVGSILNTVLVPALKLLVNVWLTVVGALLNGAAKAFGWVPGIGPKLKKAASQFAAFKKSVNDQLDGLKPAKTITVTALLKVKAAKGSAQFFASQKDSSVLTVAGSAKAAWLANAGVASNTTGGPSPVNVAAPEVTTNVYIDGVRQVARQQVRAENGRTVHRARVGVR